MKLQRMLVKKFYWIENLSAIYVMFVQPCGKSLTSERAHCCCHLPGANATGPVISTVYRNLYRMTNFLKKNRVKTEKQRNNIILYDLCLGIRSSKESGRRSQPLHRKS